MAVARAILAAHLHPACGPAAAFAWDPGRIGGISGLVNVVQHDSALMIETVKNGSRRCILIFLAVAKVCVTLATW